jgi:hypothetical protein
MLEITVNSIIAGALVYVMFVYFPSKWKMPTIIREVGIKLKTRPV